MTKKRNTNQFEEAKILSETKTNNKMSIRKLNIEARLTLQDEKLHARIIAKDGEGKIIFDKLGRSIKLTAEQIKQMPSDLQMMAMLDIPFIQGMGEGKEKITFEKIKDNAKTA